ncbi:MAG: hypothetical protein AAB426_08455 [Myxococcota bacterium]
MLRVICLALFATVAAGCRNDVAPSHPTTAVARATSVSATATTDGQVHRVACGCALGLACQNMIEVEGKYVPLTGETSLGDMAFCGQEGLTAKADGELRDGKFVARSFTLLPRK